MYIYPMLHVSELYIYPIKSLGGISVSSAPVTDRGLQHDRRWMLVDNNNRFLSQREIPEMALLKVAITSEGLLVTHSTQYTQIQIPFLPETNQSGEFSLFDDTCSGQYVSSQIDEWFTGILQYQCRLVYMPDSSKRIVSAEYSPVEKITSFSDAYPFLIIGQSSLDDLNNRLEEKVPVNRFRPNIVFKGGGAYQEDRMAHFRIGDIHFNGVKLCARCNVPTIDQDTAQGGKEPIKTLATYRNKKNKIYFGQNLIHTGEGTICVGDAIDILEVKEMPNSLISA